MRKLVGVLLAATAVAFEPSVDEFQHRSSPDLDSVENPKFVGKQCWDEINTEKSCCRLRESNLMQEDFDFQSVGDSTCWDGQFQFQECCLVENTCEGVVFQQFLDIIPKALSHNMGNFEYRLLAAMLRVHMFTRSDVIFSCPTVGLIASLISTMTPFISDDSLMQVFEQISTMKMSPVPAKNWIWEMWGLWESVSILNGQHNYNMSTAEFPDTVQGGHTPSTSKFYLPHAPGRQLYNDRLKDIGVGAEVLSAVSNFSTQISKLLDDVIVAQGHAVGQNKKHFDSLF